jgi:cation diffusion facilitator family transporter
MEDITLSAAEREKAIVKTSAIGIITNVLLSVFKAIIGIVSNSIAVTLDAVNNLSDALSSVITVIGAKLAGRAPDKKHPLGHGRIEYLSSMVVAALVLYAGITSLTESIKKIIEPETPDYSIISLIIIAVAIVAKLLLGAFVKKQGQKVSSGALVASGSDALFDAILSSSVLACAIIFKIFNISLEPYIGIVISIMIIKSGLEMMGDTLTDILGRRADADLTKEIKKIITAEPQVRGAYDLLINNYGPDKNYASVHIELPDVMTVEEVDKLTRKIESNVYKETGVILTGVGVYSFNTGDNEIANMRNNIQKIVLSHDWALQLHGFHADPEEKTARFDVVISFDISRNEAIETLMKEIQPEYPEYKFFILPDSDISDI